MRTETIGDCTLYLGDAKDVLPGLSVDHVITDPPYEDELHAAVGKINRIRTDRFQGPESLGFDGINEHRAAYAKLMVEASRGWALIFTLAEGVRAWRDDLQAAARFHTARRDRLRSVRRKRYDWRGCGKARSQVHQYRARSGSFRNSVPSH